MPEWDRLPLNVLLQINRHLGNPGVPVVLGALALINDEAPQQLEVLWQTTSDVIFVGDAWKPGYHAWISDVTLSDHSVRLTDLHFSVSINPGYVFLDRDVGTVNVKLTVLPGFIGGVGHHGYTGTKTVRVARHDKALKKKNSSIAYQAQLQDEHALMAFVMTASLNGVAPDKMPMESFVKTFHSAIYRIYGVAMNVISPDHYSSEALSSEDFAEGADVSELMVLRMKIRGRCGKAMNLCNTLLGFLETVDIEALERTDEDAREKGKLFSRKQFIMQYEQIEAWAASLPSTLSLLERLFQKARLKTKVSDHTVGSLFKEASLKFRVGNLGSS